LTASRPRIVLGSTSSVRISLLEKAGVSFVARAAPIDERSVEAPLIAAGTPPLRIAETLAAAKALAAGAADPGALTIGADQVLEAEGRRWTKPATMDEARSQLLTLAGGTHALHSAVAVAQERVVVWHDVETARLTMRKFSEAFLDAYLAAVGADALRSVGAYQLEGRGIQLFEKIEGDYFTILGLPLLPLLAFLRQVGALET
jgi:septum formation protein